MAENDTTLTFDEFKAAWNRDRIGNLAKLYAQLHLMEQESYANSNYQHERQRIRNIQTMAKRSQVQPRISCDITLERSSS